MDNKEDWKKIEEYLNNRNSEMLSKYKIDINQNIGKKIEKSKRNRKIIKRVIIITFIVVIYCVVYSIYDIWASRARKERLQPFLGIITETNVKTNLFGNGCYSYKIVSIPDTEIHVWFDIFNDIFVEDSNERLCKYYFEKWEDIEKEKFIIDESYDDCSGFLYKKKNWILDYQMHIEVNNYEEAMKAIETIIRFKEYTGDKVYFSNKVYIKAGENILVPQVTNKQSSDSMRTYIKNECLKIFQNRE